MREIINGQLFINGYATDSYGRPRTMSNGYSNQDETEAREQYLLAKSNKPIKKSDPEDTDYKYCVKVKINNSNFNSKAYDQFGRQKYYTINNEKWPIEYINGSIFIGGYATNDMREPICYETGYTDEDVTASKNRYKKAIEEEKEKFIY